MVQVLVMNVFQYGTGNPLDGLQVAQVMRGLLHSLDDLKGAVH